MSTSGTNGRRRFLRQACTLGAAGTTAGQALNALAAPPPSPCHSPTASAS